MTLNEGAIFSYVLEYVSSTSKIAFFSFSEDYILNSSSLNLKKTSGSNIKPGDSISTILTSATVNKLKELISQFPEEKKISLDFVNPLSIPLYCEIFKMEKDWLLIGIPETERTDSIIRQISVLNNELAKTTKELIRTNKNLKEAKKKIKYLSELLSICSYCRKIQNVDGTWFTLEEYITMNSETVFSHGICSDCLKNEFGDLEIEG